MRINNSRHRLILRTTLIVISAVSLGFTISAERYGLSLFLVTVLIYLIYRLTRDMDSSNRKVAYLFSAIANEDFSTRYPENVKLKSEQELNKSLNRINELVKEAQHSTRIQERYFEEILNQANIGILTINSAGHIIYANPTCKKLFNRPQLNHVKQLSSIDETLYAVLSELEPFERKQFSIQTEKDTIKLAIKSTRMEVKGEPIDLLVVQDIRNELEKNEIDAWNRLFRVLTHEIMNSIAPITSISESIHSYFSTADGERQVAEIAQDDISNTIKGLEVIEEQGNNLLSFVQSYRSFLDIPVPDRKVIEVQPFLERVKLLLEHQKGNEGVEILIASSPNNLEIFADEQLISLALINICKNAIEAMQGMENTRLSLEAGMNEEGDKQISIIDNGPGISEELKEQIFIPFFSTKKNGSGIGLSLSKQIMQVHEGSLRVVSTLDEGTRFVLTF